MKFTYFKKQGTYVRYDVHTDDCEDDGDYGYYFDYEVKDSDAIYELPALMVKDEYVIPFDSPAIDMDPADRLEMCKCFVTFLDNNDQINWLLEYYYDELREIFYDEALENENDREDIT